VSFRLLYLLELCNPLLELLVLTLLVGMALVHALPRKRIRPSPASIQRDQQVGAGVSIGEGDLVRLHLFVAEAHRDLPRVLLVERRVVAINHEDPDVEKSPDTMSSRPQIYKATYSGVSAKAQWHQAMANASSRSRSMNTCAKVSP